MDDKENNTPVKSAQEPARLKKADSPPPKASSFDIHTAKMDNVFIGISGLIGAGKTTLATALGKKLNLPIYYEPVTNNEYLADFYKDIKKYSFNMQVYLLNERFKQQQVIIWQGQGGVQDRTIYEDSIFAKMLCESGLMDERDYRTYLSLFQHMSNFMKKPNIIVHLDVNPEESLRRIRSRNRGCESGITLEYLTNLYNAYEVFLQEISRIIPVIKVDYNRFRTAEEMAEAIAEQYNTMTNIRHVTFQTSGSSSVIDVQPKRLPMTLKVNDRDNKAEQKCDGSDGSCSKSSSGASESTSKDKPALSASVNGAKSPKRQKTTAPADDS